MAFSKSTRILILLAIDSAFFLLELIVGYAVHSLALVADSFHMLNDVISLLVGLWAVKVANQTTSSKMYTYGWQRAETLGALINGVFLVALCLSIFLEAIQRFVEPQEVSHPQLVLIVGCFGLASNLLGLVLFHDHGHSHGGQDHGHSHGSKDDISAAEEGHAHDHGHRHEHTDPETRSVVAEDGRVADVLPQVRVSGSVRQIDRKQAPDEGNDQNYLGTSESGRAWSRRRESRHSRSRSMAEDFLVHPIAYREGIIAASHSVGANTGQETDTEGEDSTAENGERANSDRTPLLSRHKSSGSNAGGHRKRKHGSGHANGHEHSHGRKNGHSNGHGASNGSALDHSEHKHAQPKSASASGGAHGHSHGDLNMRGMFLHVLGDALGNVGVIASALFIWLTPFSWRFYADPLISLIITVIILLSAIPLCKAASRILLQAVPHGLSIDDIRADVESLPGVLSCHHLHVWQLSDTKLVASLHVEVDEGVDGVGSETYMRLARQIHRCLHEYGIHSSTIQPEFAKDAGALEAAADGEGAPVARRSKQSSRTGSVDGDCLLDCGDECGGAGQQCCAPVVVKK